MQDNFSTIRITDSRISTITDKPSIGVYGSGADITKQSYNATSISNSNLIFSCPIPSPNILIDREIYIQADMYFTVRIAGGVANGEKAFNPGYNALQSFPLNQSFLNSSVIINNTSVSLQSQAIVPQLLQLTDPKTLCRYNLQTAAYPDKNYLYYQNASGTTNNPIADYSTSGFDEILYGRGTTPITILRILHHVDQGDGEAANNASLISTSDADTWIIECKTTVCEPILNLSPFVFSPDPKNNAAIYGISQLNFNFTIDSQLLRFWSTIYPRTTVTQGTANAPRGVGQMFGEVSMNFNFLTAQPSDIARIPNKNIVPYENYTLYLNSSGKQFPATVAGVQGATQTLSSNSISLAVVPDLFLIYVRMPLSEMNSVCTNAYFTIQSINIYYNNKAGILSNMNSVDLYKLSVKNGLKMSYIDWCGTAMKENLVLNGQDAPRSSAARANANFDVATLGSLLVLSPCDLGLPDMLAPGSQYQGVFRFDITVNSNYQNDYGTPNAGAVVPDICCVCVESGILITENMQSSLDIGLLNANMVLNAKDSSAHIDDLHVQSGGNAQGRMRTNLDNFLVKHSARVNQVQSAGHISGGSQSAGKRIHKLNKYVM